MYEPSAVRRHGGTLTGVVLGGIIGSIVPGVGTVIGMAAGGLIGHYGLDRSQLKAMGRPELRQESDYVVVALLALMVGGIGLLWF